MTVVWTGDNELEVQEAVGRKYTRTETWDLHEPRFKVKDGQGYLDGEPIEAGHVLKW